MFLSSYCCVLYKCNFRAFFISVVWLISKPNSSTNRAVNQKRSSTGMLTFWRCQVFGVAGERRAAAFSTLACTHASVPVKIHACVWKRLYVPTCVQGRVCFLRCVFRKGTVKRDDWRHPHYTHTHTYTQICWQVNVVGYLGNRGVIQRNCICFWNSLTCNYTGRERERETPTNPPPHTLKIAISIPGRLMGSSQNNYWYY